MKKKKILVRVPNWIGDAVMVLPALELLKELRTDIEVTVLTKPWCRDVFLNNLLVDNIFIYDAKGTHNGLRGKLRLSKDLKAIGFDEALLFQNAFEAALITWLTGIPERAGYIKDLRGPLLTKGLKIEKDIKSYHHIFYYLNLVSVFYGLGSYKINDGDDIPVPTIFLDDDEMLWSDDFINTNDLGGKNIVTISPGASFGKSKMWPKENFAKLMDKYSEENDSVGIVIGGPGDRASGEEICELTNSESLNLAGKLTLRQSMALIKKSKLFVSNDSGPMHIGAALGAPTIGIFGSTEPKWTGPVGINASYVKVPMDCSPCFDRTCRFGHYDCLNNITAEMVMKKASELEIK